MSLRDVELTIDRIQQQMEQRQGQINDTKSKISTLEDKLTEARMEIERLKTSDTEQERKITNIADDKRWILRLIIGAVILALLSLVLVKANS